MGLYGTHFVQPGQILPVSGLKMLASSNCNSGKTTAVPRLFLEYLHQMENKHQIMNVHIKWDYLVPILSSLVKYYLFQG